MNREQWHVKRGRYLDRDEAFLTIHGGDGVPHDKVQLDDSGSDTFPGGSRSPEESHSCCEWAIGHTFHPKSAT